MAKKKIKKFTKKPKIDLLKLDENLKKLDPMAIDKILMPLLKGKKKNMGGAAVMKNNGGGFDEEFKALQALNREFEKAKQKPEAQKRKESLQKQIKKTPDKSIKSLLTRELKAGGKKGINRNLLKDKFLTDAELKKKYPERYKPVKPSGRTYPYPGDKNPGKPTQKPTQPLMGVMTGRRAKRLPRGDITKKMNMGGAIMKNRGGTFKGTF